MRIATKLSEDEYDMRITPVVIRLFSSPDRALRVCLLDNLPHMIDHLSQKIVTDKIFPQMVTGFGDLAPVVREQTVKAVLVIVPKLSDRVINGELLRHLAKTANDEQPGIRTNTTICLGKIARNLGSASRAKVLSAAFSRSLRDPFVHARNASLMALAATADVFSEDDCATKMLPAICPSLVDKEKMIRDQANKTLNIYLERVRKYGLTLPDTVLPPPSTETGSASESRISTPQPGTVGGQLMGWAVSSFTNKLSTAKGDMQADRTIGSYDPLQSALKDLATVQCKAAPKLPSNGLPHRPGLGAQPAQSAPVVPQLSSLRKATIAPPAETEDFDDGWGEMDDAQADEVADAWSQALVDPPRTTSMHVSKSSTASSATYDDGGEPDFEGWLSAQAQTKQQSKKSLPKGLAPKKAPAAAKPAAATAPVKKVSALPNKPVAKVVAPVPPKQDKVDDDWGEAW